MVEVALALGVVAFALLSVMALLPLGVKSNQISAEETRASMILTALEADLRNSHPLLNSGKSGMFGLQLPYQIDSVSGRMAFNSAITASTVSTPLVDGLTTRGLDEAELPVATALSPRPRYQISVVYRLPLAGSLEAVQARLVVNWPAQTAAVVADITDPSKVSGYVETLVSFPAP